MITNQLKKDLQHTFNLLTETEKAKLSNSKILITGSAGFIGFYLSHFFYQFRNELNLKKVTLLDNFIMGTPIWQEKFLSDNRFTFEKFDIINDKIENISDAQEINFVIHMASIASPTFYRLYPIETVDANVWGLRRLFEFYKDKNLTGFLFFSTSEIYGDPPPEKVPTDENYNGNVSATGPRACYDESKRFCETLCRLFAQKYQMPIGVVRPFNNYGAGMKITDKRVPADFAKNILEGNDITILSSGAPRRTFCYIADAVAGYLKILLHGKYDYFNIGIDKPEISIAEFAEIYRRIGQKIFDYKGKIIYAVSNDNDYLTNNPQRRCPNIDKARKILGYEPKILVEEGVERFLTFVKESTEENLKW